MMKDESTPVNATALIKAPYLSDSILFILPPSDFIRIF